MEDVRTLYDLIEIGQAYDLSARVLSDLDPEKPGVSPPWMHYDISPENIGVTGGGALVLIDVDSFYLEEAGKYRVSVPAWKPFRAPQALADEVRNRYAANRIDGPIAKRKMRFELALAAAECVLGPLPPSRDPVDRSLLAKWVATADSNDSAVAFWTREMSEILVDGDVRPLADIAKELNVAIKRGASTVHAPRAVPRTVVAVSSEPPEVSRAEATTKTAPDEWSAEWNLLRPSAHALRAGQLDRVRVEEYRKVLETLIERYPKRVELWDELLLIVISYQKDRAAATTIIERARQALPNNAALEQLHNVVKNWVAGD
jgi:hypothetical protein